MSQLPPDQPAPPTPPSSQPTTPPPPTVPPIDYSSLPAPFSFADFLTFRTMIAIPVIMILFWVGVFYVVIQAFWLMFHHAFCYGLSVLIVGPFVVRLYCEFLIVVFRINETLTEIHNTMRERKI